MQRGPRQSGPPLEIILAGSAAAAVYVTYAHCIGGTAIVFRLLAVTLARSR